MLIVQLVEDYLDEYVSKTKKDDRDFINNIHLSIINLTNRIDRHMSDWVFFSPGMSNKNESFSFLILFFPIEYPYKY